MPMPLWWGHINKRIFNPREIRKGERPVILHTGRTSGRTFETPLDAHPVDGGYVFILVYGPKSDWVQNIMSAGKAELRANGSTIQLTNPRLISESEAWGLLGEDVARPPGFLKVTDFLRMDA